MTDFRKNIKLLAWFNFLLDFRIYTPVLILYFAKVTGSFTLAMSLLSISMLSAAIFEVPTGVFSDLIGRKKTVVVGSIVTVMSVLFYAIGGSYWILFVGVILEGLARSLYSGNNDALLHDSLRLSGNVESYGEKKGKTDSTAQMAIAITAIIGGFVAYFSYPLVMWLSVIPAVLGLGVSLLMVDPGFTYKRESNIYIHLGEAIRLMYKNKKLRLMTLSSMIGFGQGEAGYKFRSAFIASLWPLWAIGLAQAMGSVGSAISSYWSGWLIKKWGAFRVILFGKLYSQVSNAIATLFPTIFSPLILSSNSFFYGSTRTASCQLKQNEYNTHQRATMASLDALGGNLIFALVATMIGLVADRWSPALALFSLQILSSVSTYITWYLYRKEPKSVE